MRLSSKYYPYPVITEDERYYTSSFSSNVESKRDGYNELLTITVKLNDNTLNKLINEGSVSIVHHIECPQTCYRTAIKTFSSTHQLLLKNEDVNGNLQICSFLVAQKKLENYTNPNFNTDYNGIKFNLEEGSILGIGNQWNLNINKIKDDLANTSSVFSIVPNTNPVENTMTLNIGGDKIVITLPEKTYKQYATIQQNRNIQPTLHSEIIIPALIDLLYKLKLNTSNLLEYEDKRWFKSICKAYKNVMQIEFNENYMTNMEVLKDAQKLINSPLIKSIEYLCSGKGDTNEA